MAPTPNSSRSAPPKQQHDDQYIDWARFEPFQIPTGPPPIESLRGRTWTTLTEAVEAISDAAQAEGFAISKRRTQYFKAEPNGVKEVRAFDLECCFSRTQTKAKKSHDDDSAANVSARNRATRRCDCPFRAQARFWRPTGEASITIIDSTHNHRCDPKEAAKLPGNRRRQRTEALRAEIREMMKDPKQTYRSITETLQRTHPGLQLTLKDVGSEIQKIKNKAALEESRASVALATPIAPATHVAPPTPIAPPTPR